MSRCVALSALLVALLAAPIRATASAPDEDTASSITLAAELAVGRLDEHIFFQPTAQLGASLRLKQFGCERTASSTSCVTRARLLLQAPLRLRLGPLDDAATSRQGSRLRSQDWDEPRDIARTLRFITYSAHGSPLALQLGELHGVSLGSSGSLRGYFNTINPDHALLGARLSSHTQRAEVELLIDDVLRPGLIGAAMLMRPAAWSPRHARSLWSRFGLGVELTSDLRAPVSLSPGAQGAVIVDDTSRPIVTQQRATTRGGLTASAWLLSAASHSLELYGALLWHDRLGRGEHLGLRGAWTASSWVEVSAQLELVRAHERYVPYYFSSLYQIERYQTDGWGVELPTTKLRAVSSLSPRDDLYWAPRLTLASPALRSALEVSYARARDTAGADALTASLSVAPIEQVWLRALYHQNLFDGAPGAWERAVLVSEARWAFYGPLYVAGRYNQRWRLRDDGAWSAIQDWSVGVGAQLALGR